MIKLRQNQKGIALLYVMVMATVLMTILIGLTTLVISEVRQASNIEDSTQAFYAAESAIEYAERFVLGGGTLKGNGVVGDGDGDCNDTQDASDDYTFDSNPQIKWQDLKGIRVIRGTEPPVMRLSAQGVSRGVTRNVTIDFTPDCDWDSSSSGWGDEDTAN